MRLLTGIIFSTFFTFAATAETFIWKNDVRGWLIGVDPTLGFGCFMLKKYEDSTAIRVHFNPDGRTFEFYIAHPDWRSIENNKKYPMSVQFGNRVPWDGEGHGVWIGELPSIRLALSRVNAEVFIEELMQLPRVKVHYSERLVADLSLYGSYAAMTEVLECQGEMFSATRGRTSDPFQSGRRPQNSDPFR